MNLDRMRRSSRRTSSLGSHGVSLLVTTRRLSSVGRHNGSTSPASLTRSSARMMVRAEKSRHLSTGCRRAAIMGRTRAASTESTASEDELGSSSRAVTRDRTAQQSETLGDASERASRSRVMGSEENDGVLAAGRVVGAACRVTLSPPLSSSSSSLSSPCLLWTAGDLLPPNASAVSRSQGQHSGAWAGEAHRRFRPSRWLRCREVRQDGS